ncbi:phosphodiester glycosidase family protein [bacterium]|nr:phosphodiester glycosidase family protein [bacterium]
MIRWLLRLAFGLGSTGALAAAWLFYTQPEWLFHQGEPLVRSYRENIEGPMRVAEAGTWQPIASGMQRRVVIIDRGPQDEHNELSLYAIRVDLSRLTMRFQVSAPQDVAVNNIGSVAERTGALAMINGGYFNPSLGVLGLCISGGQEVSPLSKGELNRGVFFQRGDNAFLVDRDHFSPNRHIENALQAGPFLVQDGKIADIDDASDRVTRRSAVALDDQRHVIFLATDTIFSGITLRHLAELLAAPTGDGGFGVRTALNLDGGTSTQMIVRTGAEYHLVRGFVNVPVLIGVYRADS